MYWVASLPGESPHNSRSRAFRVLHGTSATQVLAHIDTDNTFWAPGIGRKGALQFVDIESKRIPKLSFGWKACKEIMEEAKLNKSGLVVVRRASCEQPAFNTYLISPHEVVLELKQHDAKWEVTLNAGGKASKVERAALKARVGPGSALQQLLELGKPAKKKSQSKKKSKPKGEKPKDAEPTPKNAEPKEAPAKDGGASDASSSLSASSTDVEERLALSGFVEPGQSDGLRHPRVVSQEPQ